MKNKNIHSDAGRKTEVSLFPEIDLNYAVSQAEVWEKLVSRMDQPVAGEKRYFLSLFYRMALAASFLILMSITGFLKFYTKTVHTPAGRHLTLCLPDSSVIEMNAASTANYHPYWYRFSRTIELDGEAYFTVNKGSRFSVVSQRGETIVLGTSFNIFSRNNEYNVTCFTGKVRVVSAGKSEKIVLNPNEQAFINKDGFLRFVQQANPGAAKSWRENMFVFTGASIVTVMQEIERQYNIKIVFRAQPELTYTGNFSKSLPEKEVLGLVCTSLGLTFEALSDKEYLVD